MHKSSIQNDVLILNASWRPVGISTVKKTIKKMFVGHGRYVDMFQKDEFSKPNFMLHDLESWLSLKVEPTQDYIVCAKTIVVTPEIVMFESYKKMPKMKVKFSPQNILIRDGGRCQYCGEKVARRINAKTMSKIRPYSQDHVMPKSRGGGKTWKNIVTCCTPCNNKKADRTPKECNMTLLSEPIEPSWSLELMLATERRRPSWDYFLGKGQGVEEEVTKVGKVFA